MRPTSALARARPFAVALLASAAVLAPVLATGASAGAPAEAAAARLRVGTAKNATLGKRILVTRAGLTLYTLEGERRGRWLCTSRACLRAWPPLLLRRGARPTGVRFLGAIRRPDGRRQVTYRGFPLYRYAFDRKRGDAFGEGVRDVGVWHAAVAPR